MRRIYLLILLCLSLCVRAEHVFEAGIHGGIAGWKAQSKYVASQIGLHAGGHLYYSYYSPKVFGFRVGATLDHYQPGFSKLNYEDAYSTIDVENQQMDIAYSIGSLKERYAIWSVGLPVQIALSFKKFSFLIGPKVVFPLAGRWNQSVDHAALSVYYPDFDNLVEESYPLGASRDFSMTNSGQMNLPKVQWWLAMELNYAIPINTWAVNFRSYVMVGAYFNYCFTKYTPSRSMAESLIMLTDTRDGFPLQRVLTPVFEANRQGRKLLNDASLFDVGIKISYAIAPYDAHRNARKSCNCLGE